MTFGLAALRGGIDHLELDSTVSSVSVYRTYGTGDDDASESPVPR
jgi:hypothetical protein